MKAKILNPLSRALCMIALICISVAGAPKTPPGDDVLQVSRGGLEATLKIQTCGDKSILIAEWKNTNAQTSIGVLSLKSKSDQSSIFVVSVAVAANTVKVETCDDVDSAQREVTFSNFS
jgi:hypothetical protein